MTRASWAVLGAAAVILTLALSTATVRLEQLVALEAGGPATLPRLQDLDRAAVLATLTACALMGLAFVGRVSTMAPPTSTPARARTAAELAAAYALVLLVQWALPLLPLPGASASLARGALLGVVEVGIAALLVRAPRLDALALGRPAGRAVLWLAAAPSIGLLLAEGARLSLRYVPSTSESNVESWIAYPSGLLMFAMLSALLPIAEELLYRGAIQGQTERAFGRVAGALGGWLLFVAPHVPQTYGAWGGLLAIAGAGLCMALLRAWSGSVLVPILAHLAYNGALAWGSIG